MKTIWAFSELQPSWANGKEVIVYALVQSWGRQEIEEEIEPSPPTLSDPNTALKYFVNSVP